MIRGGAILSSSSGDRNGCDGAGAPGLAQVARLARRADAVAIAAEAEALAQRVAEGRFFVACAGQFKRGKSALINALVGEAVLPSGVVPVTAVVTVVRYGESRAARVLLGAGWTAIDPGDLASFVAEERNPGNSRAVQAVEVFLPHPLLAAGMCFVDTPGLGSTVSENTAATREFLPQIDAVIAVLGADPPITGDELDLLAELAGRQVPLLVVLNKADRLPDGERQQAVEFTRQVLARRLDPGATAATAAAGAAGARRVYQVSAAERLQGSGPPRDWQALLRDLAALAAGAETGLVRIAARRGEARLAARLAHELRERRLALTRPVAESMERLARLRRAIAAAEIAAGDLAPLLAAEEGRFRRQLDEDRRRFLASAEPAAERDVEAIKGIAANEASADAATIPAIPANAANNANAANAGILQGGGGAEPGAGRLAEAVRRLARRRIGDWRAALTPRAELLYGSIAARYVDQANRLLARIGELPEAAAQPAPIPAEAGFRVASRFAFHDMMTIAEPRGGRLLHLLSPRLAQRRQTRHAAGYLRRLVAGNSSRLVNDLQERMLESRRLLEAELRARVAEIAGTAARALDRAVTLNAAGALRVRDECEKLDRLAAELAAVAAAVASGGRRETGGNSSDFSIL
jgi:GTP-binding protein EngB required for normal cell division